MNVHFLAATLLLGAMAAASPQARNTLRGKKHHATDVSTTCTFDYRSGDVPTADDWTSCSFEELFGPPPTMGPTTFGDRAFEPPSGNETETMARDYYYYYWYYWYWYEYDYEYWTYRTLEPPSRNETEVTARDYSSYCEWQYVYNWYGDWYEWYYDWVCVEWYYRTFEPPFKDSSSESSSGGRAFAPASSNANKCEECSKSSKFMTVTGERMHAEISSGQCEEACVTAATKGHWEVAGWKCGPCPD
jgi:hypothetical protein